MSQFDFSIAPDYSKEEYPPYGENLHFVSRFLVTFEPQNKGRRIDLVALTYYSHFQHSTLDEQYSVQTKLMKGQTLYGFWAGFDQEGKLVISSSGSESLNIEPDKALEENFLSNARVINKLGILMPHIKELQSVVFQNSMRF